MLSKTPIKYDDSASSWRTPFIGVINLSIMDTIFPEEATRDWFAKPGTQASSGNRYQKDSVNWLVDFLNRLDEIRALAPNWDGDRACSPASSAIEVAKVALRIVSEMETVPRSIQATPDGGVAITFLNGSKYADLEFFDQDSAVVLMEDLKDRNEVIFELVPRPSELKEALTGILEHLACE